MGVINKYKAIIELTIVSLIVFTIDHFSKKLVFRFLEKRGEETSVIIPKVIYLEKVTNTGGFWGTFHGNNEIIMIVNLIVFPLLFIIFYKFIFISFFTRIGLSLVIGGALGNIMDRLLYGHVRDFISIRFIHWPIFNLADTFISCGAIIMIIHLWRSKE